MTGFHVVEYPDGFETACECGLGPKGHKSAYWPGVIEPRSPFILNDLLAQAVKLVEDWEVFSGDQHDPRTDEPRCGWDVFDAKRDDFGADAFELIEALAYVANRDRRAA